MRGRGPIHGEGEETSLLTWLADFLAQKRVEGYLVGGYIRDILSGRATRDIDIALRGNALEVSRDIADALHGAYVPLDPENQIARVVLPQEGLPGSQWHLDFSTIQGDAINDDLARRDFTMNALAARLKPGEGKVGSQGLLDPFGGKGDIEKRLVRAISHKVFQNDPCRLLRAVRLSVELGFAVEEETESLIREQSHLITTIAGERVREELCRLLSCPRAAFSLRYLDYLGILEAVMPEVAQTKGVAQPKEHFWDVFEHSVETVAAVEFLLGGKGSGYHGQPVELLSWPPCWERHFADVARGGASHAVLLKLAALLHDVAKPQCKSMEKDGRIRFLGHAREGAEVVENILERLKFSRQEIETVRTMVEYHLRPGQMSQDRELPTQRAIYRYFRDTREVGIDILFLGLADHLATRGPEVELPSWKEHIRLVEFVLAERQRQEGLTSPLKLIDGYDIMRAFGLGPGRLIGELLERVREAQATRELTTREEALKMVQQHLKERGINHAP